MTKIILLIIVTIVLLGVVIVTSMAVYNAVHDAAANRKVRKLNEKLDDLEGRGL